MLASCPASILNHNRRPLGILPDSISVDYALVLRLNRFGDPRPIILASMYRHLAHAPVFLRDLDAVLAPVDADSSLERIILGNKAMAYERSRFLARAINAPPPRQAAEIEAAIAAFVDHAIGKMVTICRAIRLARTSNDQIRS